MPKAHITAFHAARLSGSQPNYLYSLLAIGKLRGRKNHGRWEIEMDSLQELLRKRGQRREKLGTSRQFTEAPTSTPGEEPRQNTA
jgi:hypothetical protein